MPFHELEKRFFDFLAVLRGGLNFVFSKAREARVDTMRMFFSLKARSLVRSGGKLRQKMQGKSVELWWDKHAFDRILHQLSLARFSILIEIFIWKNDETGRLVASTVLKAADRGVKVRITKESIGDVFEFAESFISTKVSSDDLWKRFWNHPNIKITYQAGQSHAKVFVIDESLLLLTGMNIADEYRFDWHDYLMELRGSRFVSQYLLASHGSKDKVRLVLNRPSLKGIRPCVVELLKSAKYSIVVEQAYLSDPEVVQILLEKARKHVEIIVILPSSADLHHQANLDTANKLLTSGPRKHIRIFFYPGMVHGKVILVDRFRALVGSANMIRSSLDEMDEACVLLDGKPGSVLLKLNGILLKDMLKSQLMYKPTSFAFLRKMMAWIGL